MKAWIPILIHSIARVSGSQKSPKPITTGTSELPQAPSDLDVSKLEIQTSHVLCSTAILASHRPHNDLDWHSKKKRKIMPLRDITPVTPRQIAHPRNQMPRESVMRSKSIHSGE